MRVELDLLLARQLQVLRGERLFAVVQQGEETGLLCAVAGVADVGDVLFADAAQFAKVDDQEAARGADAFGIRPDVFDDGSRLGGDFVELGGDTAFFGKQLQALRVVFELFDGVVTP